MFVTVVVAVLIQNEYLIYQAGEFLIYIKKGFVKTVKDWCLHYTLESHIPVLTGNNHFESNPNIV